MIVTNMYYPKNVFWLFYVVFSLFVVLMGYLVLHDDAAKNKTDIIKEISAAEDFFKELETNDARGKEAMSRIAQARIGLIQEHVEVEIDQNIRKLENTYLHNKRDGKYRIFDLSAKIIKVYGNFRHRLFYEEQNCEKLKDNLNKCLTGTGKPNI
jgi:hypothetical protein